MKRICIFLLATMILPLCLRAQLSKELDSIKNLISVHPIKNEVKLNRILLYLSKGEDFSTKEFNNLLVEAQKITDSIHLDQYRGKVSYYRGKFYVLAAEYNDAVFYLNKSIAECQKFNDLQYEALSHHLLAVFMYRYAKTDQALAENALAFSIFEKLDKPDYMIESLTQSAIIYEKTDINKAISLYNKIIELSYRVSNEAQKVQAIQSLVKVYTYLEDYPAAEAYCLAALKIIKKNNSSRAEFYQLIILSEICNLQNKRSEAEETILRMLAISNTPTTQDRYALGLSIWAEYKLKYNQPSEVFSICDTILNILGNKDYPLLKGRAHFNTASALYTTNKFNLALPTLDTAYDYYNTAQRLNTLTRLTTLYLQCLDGMTPGEYIPQHNFADKNDYELYLINRIIPICEKLKDNYSSSLFKKRLALLYAKKENYTLAYKYYKEGSEIEPVAKDKEKISMLKRMMQLENNKKTDSLNYQAQIAQGELETKQLFIQKIKQELSLNAQQLQLIQAKQHVQDLAFENNEIALQNEKLLTDKLSISAREREGKVKNLLFEKQLEGEKLKTLSQEHVISKANYKQTLLFYAIALLFLLGISLIIFYVFKTRSIRLQNKLAQSKIEQEANEMLMKMTLDKANQATLRSQMNPHFIFNVLNSINKYILTADTEKASDYLVNFSRLIRLILESSKSEKIPLATDLEVLDLYLQMENMRFGDELNYKINVAQGMDIGYILIPPLLIQPFVENAIWHGLMQKESGSKNLFVDVNMSAENIVKIVISDNGIGRAKASTLYSKSSLRNKSFGMQITKDRIGIVNKLFNVKTDVNVEDLVDENNEASGTRVTIEIYV